MKGMKLSFLNWIAEKVGGFMSSVGYDPRGGCWFFFLYEPTVCRDIIIGK